MPIFISDGQSLKKLPKRPVESEKWLQDYIAKNPEVIDVGEDICILAREFQTSSGPVDLIGMGESGTLYIIEIKLERNVTRREVIAQALDYGSAIWRKTNDFVRKIGKECYDTFGTRPEEKISRCFEIDERKSKELLKRVEKSARRGDIVFVIAMDRLTPRIEDAILFINSTSKMNVLGVEIKHYGTDDIEIVASRVFGTETLKRYSENRQKWDEEEFFSHVSRKWEQEIRKIYEISRALADEIKWGSGSENASFSPIFKGCERSLFSVYSSGKLQIHLGWISDKQLKEKYIELLTKYGIMTEKQTGRFHLNMRPEEWTKHTHELISVMYKFQKLIKN